MIVIENWRKGKLGDFAKVLMGTSPKGKTCNEDRKGIPLLNGPTEFGSNHPTPVQFTTAPVKLCEKGDLLFCVRGSTTGRMNWADQQYAIGRGLAAIRHHDCQQLQQFVRGVIDWRLQNLLGRATGSTFPSVSRADIEEIECLIPPLPEQRAIAAILGSLDDKIELNRRMNETLEGIARALFKSWFVDFDPVRAKMDGRQPNGMSPEIANLFPSEFEHVNGELVPKGWKVSVLDDVTEIVIGGDWGKDAADNEFTESVLCIRGADIPSLQSGGLGRMPVRFIKKSSVLKRSLQHGDLVFEISGGSPTQSTGRPVLATRRFLQRLSMPVTCSNFCRLIRPVSNVSSYFIYCMLRSMYEADEFLQYENGTTGIKNLAFKTFSSLHTFVLPTEDVMQAFDYSIGSFYEKMAQVGVESVTLETLRDTLLPKLLSGELRVPEADKMLEEIL